MGGRGAASGMSAYGNPYGSQYHTLLEDGNIKFVTKNTRQSEALMESQTPGRIYAVIGGTGADAKVIYIMIIGPNGERVTQIDVDKHMHDKEIRHPHHGYFHDEQDPGGAIHGKKPKGKAKKAAAKAARPKISISAEERALMAYILTRWEQFKQENGW